MFNDNLDINILDQAHDWINSWRHDDAYENNNSRRKAYDLSEFEQIPLSQIQGLGIAKNPDWYKIQVSPGATTLLIDLEFTHAEGNLNLDLYNHRGKRIARSTSQTDDETIQLDSPKVGTYYIKVNPIGRPGNRYDLVWDEINLIEFRAIDGSDNNLNQSDWGKSNSQLIRLSPAAYNDGISEPRGGSSSALTSPREVSNIVFDQSESILNQRGVSDWFWQWGQFLDHDLDLTPAESGETFNIPVPIGDPEFDHNQTGTQEIDFIRSIFDSSSGTSVDNPREQINELTAYIDGSNVYGSDQERAAGLRRNDGSGKLKTSLGNNGEILLPFNTEGFKNDDPFGRPAEELFLAGDIRANEQVGLTAVHTLFVREHNRLAEEIAQQLNNHDDDDDDDDDDEYERGYQFDDDDDTELINLFEESGLSEGDFIYEAARRVVGAEIQAITYNEFLPLLLGKNALGNYSGYDETINAGISNEFSTAAFRFGHTMLSSTLQDGTDEGLTLKDSFFNPNLVKINGVDSLFSGLASQKAQEIDTKVVDDVRNFLFGQPGSGGLDLASLNIQRGRDHGIPSYTEFREELGLDPITNFAQITSNTAVQTQLSTVYDTVDQVDLWVGGLAEDHVNGALVGETFQTILIDQFTRLREGDRFYYQNDQLLSLFAPNVENTRLSDIILDNSSIATIPENVFLA